MNPDELQTTEIVTHKKKHRLLIALGVLALLLLALGGWFLYTQLIREDIPEVSEVPVQAVSPDAPIDITLDFYGAWLDARQSTSTDPYTLGLPATPILSAALRTHLESKKEQADTEIDPVLCQTTVPKRVRATPLYQNEAEVSLLVMARDVGITAQTVFILKRLNEGWYIDSIRCSPGEFDIPREFTFESEGYLLKQVPPPLDPQYWHLVFTENGEPGHTAPLLFSPDSACVALDGTKTTCDPGQLPETAKVKVYGQMTEGGAEVVRLEFVE